MFIKKPDLDALEECLKRYKRFRELNTELLNAYIQWARNGGLQQKEKASDE